MTYEQFFLRATGNRPHPWQRRLGERAACDDRLIRIPTGLGKTLGVVAAWAFHRCERGDLGWPTRLVFCLPMRVLVEQTERVVRELLDSAGLGDRVGVHVLLGGAEVDDWHLHPERPAVLVGTQDMLLSRALNRGYASPRARWPVEFGLLNHDCLWVMDEVQLMDVGLATSAQLQAFRRELGARSPRPCATWWMSATLQPDWLERSPDTGRMAAEVARFGVEQDERVGPLWSVEKQPELFVGKTDPKSVAKLVSERHREAGCGRDGPTLVIVNRVERAVEVARALEKDKKLGNTEVRLAHSRYRLAERAAWAGEFLRREACGPGSDRIVVATQVVEAGVDFSCALLFTDLAPWASLVQRFGRAARWGGSARVVVLDTAPKKEKDALPYALEELEASREALSALQNAGPAGFDALETEHPDWLKRLFPYEPRHLVLRHEVDDLFDTSADLSGADVDVSRFIRSGDERDLSVAWVEVEPKTAPGEDFWPAREALCPVPFLRAREWLADRKKRAWVWDWVEGEWRRAEQRDLFPGQTVLVEAGAGGYSTQWGWDPKASESVPVVASRAANPNDRADGALEADAPEAAGYSTIETHGREVGALARELAQALRLDAPTASLLDLAGRVHDIGKSHEAFQNAIAAEDRPERCDLAKAPQGSWRQGRHRYRMKDGAVRAGLRHELASALALFDVVRRHDPARLLGEEAEVLRAAGMLPPAEAGAPSPGAVEAELLALDPRAFDLLAFLVCSHHGKVRLAWHSSPADQRAVDERVRIQGLREGDELPAISLADAKGGSAPWPATRLDFAAAAVGLNPVTGRSWTERVLGLLEHHGPFALGWYEALLRAADRRASKSTAADPKLAKEVSR